MKTHCSFLEALKALSLLQQAEEFEMKFRGGRELVNVFIVGRRSICVWETEADEHRSRPADGSGKTIHLKGFGLLLSGLLSPRLLWKVTYPSSVITPSSRRVTPGWPMCLKGVLVAERTNCHLHRKKKLPLCGSSCLAGDLLTLAASLESLFIKAEWKQCLWQKVVQRLSILTMLLVMMM